MRVRVVGGRGCCACSGHGRVCTAMYWKDVHMMVEDVCVGDLLCVLTARDSICVVDYCPFILLAANVVGRSDGCRKQKDC